MSERDFIDSLSGSTQNPEGLFVGPYAQAPKRGPKGPHELYEKPKHRVLPYTHHLDVFVVHRPWEACKRCHRDLEEEGAPGTMDDAVEEEEDRICPHTRRNQYLALMQQIMKEGYVCISRKAETLKSGVIQISVEWWVPDEKKPDPLVAPRRQL